MQTATIDRTKEWTVEDYLNLEEGLLAQLIDGELILSPTPKIRHQRVLRNIYNLFRGTANGEVLFAPIDLHINAHNVLQPDLVFISNERSSIISERGIEAAPELVVEVISPSNGFVDRNTKKRKYLEFGVKEYWIVDPGNLTLEIYTTNLENPELYLSENGRVKSSILPNLAFDLSEVFNGITPKA